MRILDMDAEASVVMLFPPLVSFREVLGDELQAAALQFSEQMLAPSWH
jgi:hypothetical protein